jgi:hypothetical protein
MVGKQRQALLVWQQNNPMQHAEYAAQHLLQHPHWHVRELEAALEGVTAADVLQLGRSLRGQVGGRWRWRAQELGDACSLLGCGTGCGRLRGRD